VLTSRYTKQRAQYAERIPPSLGLAQKVRELGRLRTDEGYMAEVTRDGETGFVLIENHCPICAAATACQGFCAKELDLFRAVLGPGVTVERSEHIVSGDRRCVYRITPSN
jgi:predicted ArsR family transcriptional regulator